MGSGAVEFEVNEACYIKNSRNVNKPGRIRAMVLKKSGK